MYSFGDVVVLPFSYTDLQSTKRRPALILLDEQDGDLLVARITRKQYDSNFDVALQSWDEVGLLVPSYVRIHKLITIDSEHVIKTIGSISEKDLEATRKAFQTILR